MEFKPEELRTKNGRFAIVFPDGTLNRDHTTLLRSAFEYRVLAQLVYLSKTDPKLFNDFAKEYERLNNYDWEKDPLKLRQTISVPKVGLLKPTNLEKALENPESLVYADSLVEPFSLIGNWYNSDLDKWDEKNFMLVNTDSLWGKSSPTLEFPKQLAKSDEEKLELEELANREIGNSLLKTALDLTKRDVKNKFMYTSITEGILDSEVSEFIIKNARRVALRTKYTARESLKLLSEGYVPFKSQPKKTICEWLGSFKGQKYVEEKGGLPHVFGTAKFSEELSKSSEELAKEYIIELKDLSKLLQ